MFVLQLYLNCLHFSYTFGEYKHKHTFQEQKKESINQWSLTWSVFRLGAVYVVFMVQLQGAV